MNRKHYFLFFVKNISLVQFSSCHTSNDNILASNFPQTTVAIASVQIILLLQATIESYETLNI